MPVVNAVMVPHPPLIIPQVGRGDEKKIQATIDAYSRACRMISASEPDTIVITSPHSVMYSDWFHISPGKEASGSFAQFGAPDAAYKAVYDREFADELSRSAAAAGFPAGTDGQRDPALDHATLVPLHFLSAAYGVKALPPIVRIGLSGLSLCDHYRLGILIKQTADKLGRRISVVASGDLSHRLAEDGPYGFRPEGPQYDSKIMDVMGRSAFSELLDFSDSFCSAAGECGHRSFVIMAGCFDGVSVDADVLSYEGPFGVGYGVCTFTPSGRDDSRFFLERKLSAEKKRLTAVKESEDECVRLARLSVETYVKTGHAVKTPRDISEELLCRRAGVFTSLHKHGMLRGCIGTISPTAKNIAEEILQNAVSACSRDPRFAPVTESELPFIEYSVDVLDEPEDISSPDMLDVKKYGVIASSGMRRGLLLPNLDGVDTIEEQIDIARRKGGIAKGEKFSLQRFEVVRHV